MANTSDINLITNQAWEEAKKEEGFAKTATQWAKESFEQKKARLKENSPQDYLSHLKDLRNSKRNFIKYQKTVDKVTTSDPADSGKGMEKAAGIVGNVLQGASAIGEAFAVGDKNFGQQSEMIDQGVHAASKFASQFGPWGLLAGGIMESANLVSKMGGQTIQGFQAGINSDSYGEHLDNYDTRSTRNWLAALTGGLTGKLDFNQKNIDRLMAARNEAASKAIHARSIVDEQRLRQEATENSAQDILKQNEIALNGGLQTDIFSA